MITGDIPVTRPFLPPLEEFQKFLQEIWDSHQLTNNGKFVRSLEEKLRDFLEVPFVSLTTNGTTGLSMAIKALGIKGEVITTPFSFPATTHVIWWTGNTPVFVDIEPGYLNIDSDRIERAITERTSAILATHVFGNPCDIDRIRQIAEKHDLVLIFDACQGFGIKYRGQSLLKAGDLSVLSFHPTKVFTTIEGGAVVCHSKEMKKKLDLLRNFGIEDEETISMPGINGKMNEIQAAFGLLQLKYFEETNRKRMAVCQRYTEKLEGLKGIRVIKPNPEIEPNCTFFPILVEDKTAGISRDIVYDRLKDHRVFSRKYFTPLLSRIPEYSGLPSAAASNLPVAERLAKEVLCLPVYPDLELAIVDDICELIRGWTGQ